MSQSHARSAADVASTGQLRAHVGPGESDSSLEDVPSVEDDRPSAGHAGSADMTADAPRDLAPAAGAAVLHAAEHSGRDSGRAQHDPTHYAEYRQRFADELDRDYDDWRRSRRGDDASADEGAAASFGRAVSDTVLDSGRSDRDPPEHSR